MSRLGGLREIPVEVADAARTYAGSTGVTEQAVWDAALLVALHRYPGRDPVPALLAGDPTFAELAERRHRAGDRAAGHLVDHTTRYDSEQLDRLAARATTALRRALASPRSPVANLDILPDRERRLVLETWNPAPTSRRPGLLHDVISGHDPARVAIRFRGTELTYGELEERSHRLAHALRRAGIGYGDIVGLLLDRGPHLPLAQIAVMKAGAAWLPLDPQHPPARLGYLAGDAGAALVLTTTDLAALADASTPDLPRWRLDDLAHRVAGCPNTPPEVTVSPDDPAYLLYTSGSTGVPKGVLVPHRCAHSYCYNAVELYRTTPDDRVAQASNPAFDASVFDTYATFLAGATLISAPRETIADTDAFVALIREEQVTLSFIPPAVLALLDPERFAGSRLRGIFSAGEALPPEQASRWSRPGLELHNSYGPTETTVVVTDYLCTPEPLPGPTPIGTALPNHRLYALDERLRPVPIGVTGQLYVAGDGVTYGYRNRPGLTAERFLPDPFPVRPGERMYATGDLVRWRSDGLLEFLGRSDRQVQLRGQRVELGEIEHTLTQHPQVRQCAVQLHDGDQLVAFLAGEPELDELRQYLADRLPTYMIPTTIMMLPALPLTPNGKLDAARLPAPTPTPAEHRAPGTDIERWLVATWRDVIGVDRVGTTDSFFDLGGNSLHGIQLVARARAELGVELHLRHLFAHPELGDLATYLAGSGQAVAAAPITQISRTGTLPCTRQQEGLWFQQQLDPSSAVYHIGLELRLRGRLDVAALGLVLRALVARHEALRTRFAAEDGLPRQVIDPAPAAWPLSIAQVAAADVPQWVADEVRRPMDLADGPLLRTSLARVGPDEHVLVLVLHHIVADGWSARLLAGELSRRYAAEVGEVGVGGEQPLPEPPFQLADHAAWQRRQLDGGELDRQLAFWRSRLADLPTVDFPTDRPRPVMPTGAGDTIYRRLPDEIAETARDFARTHQVSSLAVHQAALLTVLHRYTGQTDLPIGSIFSGRTRVELERIVGFLANPLLLRTEVDPAAGFTDLVRRCHDTVLDATAHQDAPFAMVVDALKLDRVPGRNPLFQISLSLQPPAAALAGLRLGDVTATITDVSTGYSRFDLAIAVIEAPDGRLDLQVEYSTELFDPDRIDRFLDDFLAVLAGGLAHPDTATRDLGLPGRAQQQPESAGEIDTDIADLERLVAERAELERLLAEKRAARERLLADRRADREHRAAAQRISPVPREGSLPCTHLQEGVWFDQQLDPHSTAYLIPFALRLRGALDVPALSRALHALVERHESLRTRFVAENGRPRQVVEPAAVDWSLPVTEVAAGDLEQWVSAEVAAPMDLAGTLFRPRLARLGPDDHVLVLVVHHIVADGYSVRILAEELPQLYAAEANGRKVTLPDLPVQPADHAAWQRARLDGGELDRQLAFWRETLADLPTVDLPADRPRPSTPTSTGNSRRRRLPEQLASAARGYAREQRVSLLAVTQAALLTVLYRYTGQTDLPTGSIFSGRTRADIEPLVGYFVNPLVLRTRLAGDPSFAELVDRCYQTVLAAIDHQDVPFGLVVDSLHPERVPGRNPLFQINLSLQPPSAAIGELRLGEVTAEPLPVSSGQAHFDLAIGVLDSPAGELDLLVDYATGLFDADRIERLLDHLVEALTRGLASPAGPVTGIDILPSAERRQVLYGWNETAVAYPAQPIHDLVAAVAARTPAAVALVDHDGTNHTYQELDSAANRLAHRLRRHGVGPDEPVGVCLERGAALVTALLATWKAGGAYLPLDPELPPARRAFLLADAAPAVVITDSAHAGEFAVPVTLDSLSTEPETAPDARSKSDSTAYLLYTSGSTGAPKGVAVPLRGVHNRIAWMQDAYRLRPDDRVLQKTPYGFDVSVWEFFWPLVTGATLVLAAPGGHRDPTYLHELITREGITTVHFVPTMLRRFLDGAGGDGGPLPSLRRVFSSGEALPADLVRRFQQAYPDADLHNLYGPTETSIDVTAWRCEPEPTTVPIGRPIANVRTYVLDGELRPAPIGVPGQLFVAGAGVAQGYRGQPALTAQSFLPDPYGGQPGQRMYATGDLARWRADGVLEYLGRTDRQIQLHGQRVELSEVEHALRQHPQIRQSAVTVHDGTLAGYVVGDADLADVRRFLADRLPTHLIPTALMALPELPTTPNGKLDTAGLPDPAPAVVAYVEPRTDTERWLAGTWRDLLRVDRVGTGDTFFDLGANSLHITQLTARIRDQLGIQVHPRHVFGNPTLADLAQHIDESDGRVEAPDPLVPLRPAGTWPPLFLVHPVGGAVTHYLALAELLGADQPVHAIEDPRLHGCPPAASLAERAREYTELIRRVQPHGPYHLGGWSLGGAVAQEMAGQLADAGEPVALVLALDTRLPVPQQSPTDLELLTWFVVDVAGTAGAPLPEVDLDSLHGLDRGTLEQLALEFLAGAGLAPPDTHDDLRRRMQAFTTNIAHYAGHRPREYRGRLVHIDARDNWAALDRSWSRARSPHVEQLDVPGDHYTMLRPPHVGELAAVIQRYLGASSSERSGADTR